MSWKYNMYEHSGLFYMSICIFWLRYSSVNSLYLYMQFKNSACQKKNNVYEYNSECFGDLVQIIITPLSLRTGYSFSQETLLWGLLALEVVDTFGPR